MKKSFSLIELIIVLIVVGILYSSVSFTLANSSLNQAADQLISHINYTRHLALRDNKFQYYPIDKSNVEMNRTKYWFKQWWQIRFSKNSDDEYFYEIFSDEPIDSKTTNFNGVGNLQREYAINPVNNKFYNGNEDNDSYDHKLNLTKSYNIVKLKFENFYNKSERLVFNSYGNVFLREGDDGDANDTNPYDEDKRIPLLKTAKITLCKNDNCDINISICISSKIGNAYLCK